MMNSQVIFETTIAAPLEAVWAFHQDVQNLAVLSPPGDGVKIEAVDLPLQEGSQITLSARSPIGRIRWIARIVEQRPPHAVVFGQEARFVDEQLYGPFKYWRHEHEFEAMDSRTTRLVDRITYRLPLWPVSLPADWLFIRPKLHAMFRYRHRVTHERLDRM